LALRLNHRLLGMTSLRWRLSSRLLHSKGESFSAVLGALTISSWPKSLSARRSLPRIIEQGSNANMCDALVDLLEKTTDRLKFEIAWSPEWHPPSDVLEINAFAMKPSTTELVRDAAGTLRRVETARNYTVVGKVIRLKSEHNPADLLDLSSSREVVLQYPIEPSLSLRATIVPMAVRLCFPMVRHCCTGYDKTVKNGQKWTKTSSAKNARSARKIG
jgi:hypothetical protein